MLNEKNHILVYEDVKISLDGSKFIRIYDKSIKNFDKYPRKYINANIYETNNFIIVKTTDNDEENIYYSFENKDELDRCFNKEYIQEKDTGMFNNSKQYYVDGVLKRTFDKVFYFPKHQTHIQYIYNQTSEEFIKSNK